MKEAVHMKVVEFKFPNGDFEIETAVRVPTTGEAIVRRGQMWKIDYVELGSPPVIMLRPAREQVHHAKPMTAGR